MPSSLTGTMAPTGGPSLTSQARAAELNAAAAARARFLKGELADISELPSSQPISLADFTMRTYTRNKGPRMPKTMPRTSIVDTVEAFKRPNRPVDRHFPPVAPPVPVYHYPPAYVDPRAPMYCPAPIPVTEYYYPPYQSVQGYQHMHSSYTNTYVSVPTPRVPKTPETVLPRNAVPLAAATPGSYMDVSTPVIEPSRESSPEPSPEKSSKEAAQIIFRPQDLSPSMIEVEIMRSKALTLTSPVSDQRSQNDVPRSNELKASPVRSTSSYSEVHYQDLEATSYGLLDGQCLGVDDSGGQPKYHTKHAEQNAHMEDPGLVSPSQNTRKSVRSNQLAIQATSDLEKHIFDINQPPMTERTSAQSPLAMAQGHLLLPIGFKLGSDVVFDAMLQSRTHQNKQPAQDNTGKDSTVHALDGCQKYDSWSSCMTSKATEGFVSKTHQTEPRKLQSPFQHHHQPPVKIYEPIVNKYSKNIFESEHARQEQLHQLNNGETWRRFRCKPQVDNSSFPSKGISRFLLLDEGSQSSIDSRTLMPPPGFALSGPLPLLLPAQWNPVTGYAKRNSQYYERILDAEDWFSQSISEKELISFDSQRVLEEEMAMSYMAEDKPNNHSIPDMTTQTLDAIKLVVDRLASYTNRKVNEQMSFGFGETERVKRTRRRRRRPRSRKHSGDERGKKMTE